MSHESANSASASAAAVRSRYADVQSAPRFPVKLPIQIKSQGGDRSTESENISSNGVLFQHEIDMPVGSTIDFTISLPAEVVGAECDVKIECRGRVVRSTLNQGRCGVGVMIDEYQFERR